MHRTTPTFLVIVTLMSFYQLNGRDPRRPKDPTIPTIIVCSTDPEFEKTWISHNSESSAKNQSVFQYSSRFLRLRPIKKGFDYDFFKQHLLPEKIIQFRNKLGNVSGSVLSKLANDLVEEIKVGQKKFTHFTILKDKDFNYKTFSGLLILKFNQYPFVIKLSIEHPHTMVQPFSKNIETTGIFISGGNLRHLSNFTRITNLHRIKNMLSYNPFYVKNLDFPRKWYWQPIKSYDLKIQWKCNGNEEEIFIPSIYATISDFIETEPNQPQNELNKLAMKVATDTGFLIDPHSGNIVIEQGSHTYVLLDTEDFRLMAGLEQSMKATKYIGWYLELMSNGLKTLCFRNKQQRIEQSTIF